jgi:hypothetical protein
MRFRAEIYFKVVLRLPLFAIKTLYKTHDAVSEILRITVNLR